jgi:peptidoglycan-N-acetylglucosamine deacetylase
MQTIDDVDLYDVGSYMINGQSGEEMIRLVKDGEPKNALVVFLFHGVGGEHSLNVALAEHRKLLSFLHQHEQEIWVATLVDVCAYIRESRKER